MSIIITILVLGIIVLIHEFGHFLLAKKNGIGVIEFSVGMGPRLLSTVKGETRYSIKLFPFGGSCMMVGEDAEEKDPKAFNNKSVWARIAVIAAGPIFNFILAFILAMVIVGFVGYDAPEITGVMDGFSAQEQGLQAGDIITKINGKSITVYRDIQMYQMFHAGENMELEYVRTMETGGKEKKTALIVPQYSEEYEAYMMGIELSPYRTPVTSVTGLIKYSAYEVKFAIQNAVTGLGMLISGNAGMDDVVGPLGMVDIVNDTVQETRPYGIAVTVLTLCNLCLLFSANLGALNLLPIPALDGGRLVFLIIEALRGKPINREKEGMIHMAGMILLMGFMIVVMFHDVVTRIFP